MSMGSGLHFRPVPLRPEVWVAEANGLTYTIFKSTSGYVVHCGRRGDGRTGDTPMEGAPRGLHQSFDTAAAACGLHFQNLIGR
jgi:hypothetical protein